MTSSDASADLWLERAVRQLVEHAPVAAALLDLDLRYVAVSRTWSRDFSLPERDVVGRRHYDVFPHMPERWRTRLERCLTGESLSGPDEEFVGRDGRVGRVDWAMQPWRNPAGEICGVVQYSVDTTAQYVATEKLRAREARLAGLFAAMSEGLVVQAADGRIVDANAAAETALGLSRDQILGRTSLDPQWRAIREDGTDFPGDQHPAMVTLRTGEPLRNRIMGVRTGAARTRWLSINTQPLPASSDPDAGAVLATFVDVTLQREAFQQIRALAQRLEDVRESERRAIAETLHEGIAQDLFALRLALRQLRSESTGRVGVLGACDAMEQAVERCLSEIRNAANDLRPASLAHLGIAGALRAHADFFGPLSGLTITVSESGVFPRLQEPARVVLFRAAQEALTNVSRHAEASRVTITLRANATHVLMDVTDDGVGIADDALTRPGCLGLLGLRERFLSLGGSMWIERNPDAPGTTMTVALPREGA